MHDPDGANPPIVSLLFAAGQRPHARDIAALAEARAGFALGLPSAAEGRVELVAGGLTFDLTGLAPGPPAAEAAGGDGAELSLEAVALEPGPHLAGGAGMPPVQHALASVAAGLALLPGVRAVAWHEAPGWSAPDRFRDSVLHWREGPWPIEPRVGAPQA